MTGEARGHALGFFDAYVYVVRTVEQQYGGGDAIGMLMPRSVTGAIATTALNTVGSTVADCSAA